MINVIASTVKTQGFRRNDFCFVPEDEPVMIGVVCDKDAKKPDGSCGCSRSLVGFGCYKATTTVKITEMDLTKEQYITMYINSWLGTGYPIFKDTALNAEIMFNAAQRYPKGTILEYRAGMFSARSAAR